MLSDQVVLLGLSKKPAQRADHPTRLICVRTTPHRKRGIRQPVPDIPLVERLRQAIASKDVQATAQAVRQCLEGQILPEGFLRRLLQQHGLGEVPVQPPPVVATPSKPTPPCQGCGGAKYNPAGLQPARRRE